jgi:SAM-dependent methyltransferase
VSRLPVHDDVLDDGAVDAILVRAHYELQRLNEEFQQARRVLELLEPLVEVIRSRRPGAKIRIFDVGCGLGYVIRWLASHAQLGEDVVLRGYDFNTTLIAEARRLADAEGLRCDFVAGNAFDLQEPAQIYFSNGVLHHISEHSLVEFFAQQAHDSACAFMHFDVDPSWLAPVGAWLFHRARMREPLARHDGVLSALRAHPGATLTRQARIGAPGFTVGLFRVAHPMFPVTRTIRPVVGLHPDLHEALLDRLGVRARLFQGARP